VWADFLTERGIDFSTWPLPATSSVAYLDRLDLLDSRTLAVHLLDVDNNDLDILVERGVKTVVCPRSNQNLHHRLPCIRRLIDHGLSPALGTDSLASCDSLSMADEMAFVAQHYPDLSAREILAMATCYGARALGLDRQMGTLEPGRWAQFLFVPAQADTPEHLLEIITRNE
jgi:cytosine/adenosine deaminase-related metal-dependent hydrolase